jgi:7-cyano-7-deazaguanine synthase
MKKAIVLLSGGIDSTVVLALALAQDRSCFAISFDYGQRHAVELEAAKKVTQFYNVPHRIIKIDKTIFNNSSLVNSNLESPRNRSLSAMQTEGIPNTYVPARNTLFLAFALSQCEMHQAQEIHFGANAADYMGYPDCRPAYLQAFQSLMNAATKQAVEGEPPKLITPLIHWNKAQIIRKGLELHAPLEDTFSCYNPINHISPCNECDACLLRQDGFAQATSAL